VAGPAFDLLFLANLGWPLLLLPGLLPAGGQELHTEFWAVYFLIAPHRWLTLVLVAADPDRRDGRGRLFVGLAIAAAAVVAGVYAVTGAFACLAVIDYVWSAWHFASQHQGVARMYARKSGGGPDWLERHALRLFLCHVLLRTAGWTTGWLEADTAARGWLNAVDLGFLAIPAAVLGWNLPRATRRRLPKLAYLGSILTLYTLLLLALRNDWRGWVIALTAAASMVHATEYLAVVTHYARGRTAGGSDGAFRRMAGRWLALLGVYAVVLGLVGVWLEDPSAGLPHVWVGLNLWAAFLHYAYDGLIWKLRRPATAQALGVGP
jgi:hypothetical protein